MDKNRPVWITGVPLRRSRRSMTLRALTRYDRTTDVALANRHILEERQTPQAYSFEFLVPQWLAHACKLNYTPE